MPYRLHNVLGLGSGWDIFLYADVLEGSIDNAKKKFRRRNEKINSHALHHIIEFSVLKSSLVLLFNWHVKLTDLTCLVAITDSRTVSKQEKKVVFRHED